MPLPLVFEVPPATKTLPLDRVMAAWFARATARLPVSQKPSTLKAFEIPVMFPAVAASA